jgi:hypothetical protein
MISIKTLAAAAAISAGFAFAIPATSQAMPVGPIKVQSVQHSNLVDVHYKKKKHWHKKHGKHKWREARRWRHHRWARYCDPWDGCYRRRHARLYYPYYYDEPYYGYGYGYPYGGYYGPGFYGPGIGFSFRFH